MLSLVAVILIVGIVVLAILATKYDLWEDCWPEILEIAMGIGFVIIVAVLIGYSTDIATENIIDQKIEMYEEQNTLIESEIDAIVLEYMDFESDTYKDLKSESSITLVNLYPELKSDELVQQQIDIYMSNREKIIDLKTEKIDIAMKKWLLYFGR